MSPPISETINVNWAGIQQGKPFYTLSGVSGATLNAGADFGPDSVNPVTKQKTTTAGQAECDAFLKSLGGGVAYLVNGAVLTITPSAGNVFSSPVSGTAAGLATSTTSNVGTAVTTSAAFVMAGYGLTFTPKKTGIVLVLWYGGASNNTGGDGVILKLAYGTGAAPSGGVAAVGTQAGVNITITNAGANAVIPFSHVVLITGLTVGTTYWFDLQIAQTGGGTAASQNGAVSFIELAA